MIQPPEIRVFFEDCKGTQALYNGAPYGRLVTRDGFGGKELYSQYTPESKFLLNELAKLEKIARVNRTDIARVRDEIVRHFSGNK